MLSTLSPLMARNNDGLSTVQAIHDSRHLNSFIFFNTQKNWLWHHGPPLGCTPLILYVSLQKFCMQQTGLAALDMARCFKSWPLLVDIRMHSLIKSIITFYLKCNCYISHYRLYVGNYGQLALETFPPFVCQTEVCVLIKAGIVHQNLHSW